MRKAFAKLDLEWNAWTTSEHLHVGSVLIDIFYQISGDISIQTVGKGKGSRNIVVASENRLKAVERAADYGGPLMTHFMPTIIPPVDWSKDNLTYGGYFSENITPYPLVKGSRRAYKNLLQEEADAGNLDRVFDAVNALQRTPWSINTKVLDAIRFVYENNIPCGKLPQADLIVPDGPPAELQAWTKDEVLTSPEDHPIRQVWNNYQAYRATIHEGNRRVIGKRIMAQRAFHLAEKFSKYEQIFFPHDMDSRGRLYPKPAGLNPQGPDYVKGLLQFASGKSLGRNGLRWLAVHGANCYGEDKLPINEREDWAVRNLESARSVANDPRKDLWWTKADNPAQFLAWCYEWSEASLLENPEEYVSHLHVDLDATCSGLQHFSAMLRDAVGGYHVNMTPNDVRQDVYGAVAAVATQKLNDDLGGDQDGLAKAWLDFGIDRKITKRSVMVKPYAGTRTSCNAYVAEAVQERIDSGEPIPLA